MIENKRDALVRRLIRHNERVRVPREERDKVENLIAVRMITLIGCLDYAMLDLASCLEAEGLFVRGVKRNINRASDLVKDLHQEVFDLIKAVDSNSTRLYSDLRDRNWWSIDEHVHHCGVDSAYSVVMALCRLISDCNSRISKRYSYRGVDKLKYVVDMVNTVTATDRNIDFIVDRAVVVK